MAKPKSNAPVSDYSSGKVIKSPMKDQVKSGNTTTKRD